MSVHNPCFGESPTKSITPVPFIMSVFSLLRNRGRAFCAVFLCALGLAVSSTNLGATTVIPPEFEELVHESDYVVHGRVTAAESAWEQRGQSRVIVTRVSLEVLETVAGDPPTPLVLTMLGGKVGDKTMVIEGAPRFKVGDEDILFVQGNGRMVSPLTRIMHGRYRIAKATTTGRKYVTRNNSEPLTDTSEVSQPLHAAENAAAIPMSARVERALSPADFVSQIRAVHSAPPAPSNRD